MVEQIPSVMLLLCLDWKRASDTCSVSGLILGQAAEVRMLNLSDNGHSRREFTY
jgi:hypothetical protein